MILDRRRYGKDNYAYLLAEGEDAALVDPGDPIVALGMAAAHGARPRWILHTHGHPDHTGGSSALRDRLGARVLGHGADADQPAPGPPPPRGAGLGRGFRPDEDLAGRTELALGALRLRVHAAPGHTPGAVLFEAGDALLTGDTLFWGGAGNCRSGGDPSVLARTFLGVLAALPGALRVHPGHDYAEQNFAFVLGLEPGNDAARRRLDAARAARARGEEPEPPTLDEERTVNPFLRAADPRIRDIVSRRSGLDPAASPEAVFVALRALRDRG